MGFMLLEHCLAVLGIDVIVPTAAQITFHAGDHAIAGVLGVIGPVAELNVAAADDEKRLAWRQVAVAVETSAANRMIVAEPFGPAGP